MIYDAATGNVVLFGGYNGQRLNDTWTWDGATWTQQHPATAPRGRGAGSMTYDPASQRIVLFGGTSRNQQFYPTSVRTWDGTTWQPPS